MINLPFPPSSLHPNSRTDRRAATSDRQQEKWAGMALAREYVNSGGVVTDHLILTFYPPDNHRRDLDNLLSACKAVLDGVSQGVKRDDCNWSFTLHKGKPDKGNPRVQLMFAIQGAELPFAGWIS